MSVTSEVYRSVRDLPMDQWEQVRSRCSGPVSMDHRFLSVIENTMGDVAQLWYALFFSGHHAPVACACMSILRVDLTTLAGPGTQRVSGFVRRFAPDSLYRNILFCGLPISLGQQGLLLTPEADTVGVLAELDMLMTALAHEHHASLIVFKEHGAEDLNALQTLLQRGYRQAEGLSMYVFNDSFRDFKHYLSSLKSHYRHDIRRSLRKLEENNIEIVRWTDPDVIRTVYTQELHALYLAVVDNADNKLEVLPREFFHGLSRQFPQEVALLALVQNGRVLAFNWSLATPSTYHFLFCGMDYEKNREMDLYFNLMYAELDYGLRHGADEIAVGQTSGHFKGRLGCRPRPLYLYVKAPSRVMAQLVNLSFAVLFPPRPRVSAANLYSSTEVKGES